MNRNAGGDCPLCHDGSRPHVTPAPSAQVIGSPSAQSLNSRPLRKFGHRSKLPEDDPQSSWLDRTQNRPGQLDQKCQIILQLDVFSLISKQRAPRGPRSRTLSRGRTDIHARTGPERRGLRASSLLRLKKTRNQATRLRRMAAHPPKERANADRTSVDGSGTDAGKR